MRLCVCVIHSMRCILHLKFSSSTTFNEWTLLRFCFVRWNSIKIEIDFRTEERVHSERLAIKWSWKSEKEKKNIFSDINLAQTRLQCECVLYQDCNKHCMLASSFYDSATLERGNTLVWRHWTISMFLVSHRMFECVIARIYWQNNTRTLCGRWATNLKLYNEIQF